MAWWTELLFFRGGIQFHNDDWLIPEENFTAKVRRVFHEYLKENFVDFLYYILSIFTYFYLAAVILVFFFENRFPPVIPYVVDALSEPYLGALGVYVVVKEIERRRGRQIRRRWGEFFAHIWILFLIAATSTVYFSEYYHLTPLYQTVVTNALAALIIRIGTIIK